MNDKIEGSLAEGRALMAAGRPRDAALVFERALLLAPDDPDVRAGRDSAHAAIAELDRANEERLAAEESFRPGWYDARPADEDVAVAAASPSPRAARPSARSRMVLGSACAVVFVTLGAAVAANWDGLLRRLAQAPVPRDSTVAVSTRPASRVEDRTIADARRLLEQGDAARAVALLDSVSPEQPSYPFARQLRGQAERALRQPGAPR